MNSPSNLTQIEQALAPAQTILIFLPQKMDQDKVAAGLSLYLSLKKAAKQVSILCSRPMTVEYSTLVGVDKISEKPKGKNLTISFDYVEDSIEKVSYNIENGKFNLLIQAKEGSLPLSTEKVKYIYSGSQADLIFILGALTFEDLGEVYETEKEIFEKGKTVNIDIHSNNSRFAKINLVDSKVVSYSEVIARLLANLRLPVDSDIASNLLTGIQKATNIFSSAKIGPTTFEAIAFCLKAGGQPPIKGRISLSPVSPSPDWLEPKVYKGNTVV